MKNSRKGWSCSRRSGIWWSCSFEKIGASEITGCHLGNLVSLTDHCDLFFVCEVDIMSHLINETPCGPYRMFSCACVSMRTVQGGGGVAVSWGPPPSMPTSSSEPSLRPCIHGVWVLPPGAGLQAQTPHRGIWTPQPGSGPAQETPAGAPTSLSAQAVLPYPSQVVMRANVTLSAPPPSL